MNKNSFFALMIAFVCSAYAYAEMNVPIQLRLKSPGGTYPTETNLTFKLVILTPASGCILREEDFSSQTITNGNVSLNLGSGVRGISDPSLTLNQVYDNSKTKTGLTCVDASNNIVSTGQSYVPASSDGRIIRVLTAIGGDPILANFNMRATPYAIQAESVGGKSASDLIVKDATSQMNQTNLNDLLLDVTRFNNLKSIALSGQAASATTAATATNFSGALAGDVSGTQGATSVSKIKGVAVSATAPTAGQVLQFDGAQYVPSSLASGTVVSVAGKSGIVTLVSSDVSGFGDAAGMNVGSAAGTVAAGNDSRLLSAYSDTLNATALNTASTLVKRDASGNVATTNLLSSNNSTNNLYLYEGVNSLRLKAPAGLAANFVLTLPSDDGTAGQFLQTDGSGNLTWVTAAGGGGAVMGVTASAPLASSGGTNPNLTITQSGMSSPGFLSSTDWTTFNSKQNNLGFTPLDSAFFNAAIASASCSPNQTLYWNSISSEFLCQTISFPASDVTSVAGRTGAIVLASSDVSGLGAAAALNVGTGAGTVAAGNDSRIVNAIQSSAAFSGDVTGTLAAISVVKIQGEPVSAAPPTSGDVLRYNGTEYLPSALPADAVSSVAGKVGVVTLASSDISGLGGAAGLNVGAIAGTVAAGNDSRIVNAIQTSSTFSGDVSGTSSTVSVNRIRGTGVSAAVPNNGDILQFNGTQYVPVAIPAAPVSTVAGRTGAIVLASSDISGLGGAAGLNVGTAAGTVAAGNDSRMVNAIQTSSAFSGDVSGTSSTVSVNAIRGTGVSAAVPNNGDVLQFNGTQYVPVAIPSAPVTTVAGRTGAVVLASSDISGLNFGTSAGTFAVGDDSRITGSLQSSVFNGYVASSSCTSTQSLYWNSVSSQFLCQNISFPAAPVSTVAGRTGAIVLASSDISGLGTAAAFNVGVATNNIVQLDGAARIPASTLPAIALTTSSVHSGDVSGTSTTMSVDRLKGVAVSAAAPVAGQALVYNGTNWVPTTGFPTFSRSSANQTFSSATVANVTSLSFAVVSGVTYKYKFNIMYTSAATTTGLRLGLTYPAVTSASGLANIASGADGTGAYFQGLINTSGDSVMAASSPSATATLFAQVEGIIVPTAAGNVQLTAATEIAASNIIILAGSFVEVVVIP